MTNYLMSNASTVTYSTFLFPQVSDYDRQSLQGQCKWNMFNTALLLLLGLTLSLNLAASVVLFRVPLVTVRGRSNPVYLCIRFLNISDILQAILLLSMPFFATPDCEWIGGEINCKIMGFLVLSLLLVSPLITILMAFDRVIALYQPFKYRSHLGLKMLKILLPSACVLVCAITILPVFGVGEYHVVRGRRLCLLDTITDDPIDRTYVIVVHFIFLLALLFMAACSATFQIKMVTMATSKKNKLSTNSAAAKRTRNATITTMAVCGIFIVCYLPYVVRVLVEAFTIRKSSAWVTWLSFGLAFLQPMLNPVVCLLTNVRYRHELQVLLRRIKRSDLDTSSESATFTHRGPFSEFRRRLSGSGHRRNSKRGSGRGKELPITSPRTSEKVEKDLGKHISFYNAKLVDKSDGNSDVFEEGIAFFPVHRHNSLERHRAAATFHRKQSQSSGIRSIDSHDLAVAVQVNDKPIMFGPFGLRGREQLNLCEGKENSGPVSIESSPHVSQQRALRESACSSSLPLLFDNNGEGISLNKPINNATTQTKSEYRLKDVTLCQVYRECLTKDEILQEHEFSHTRCRPNSSHYLSEDNVLTIQQKLTPHSLSGKPYHRDSGMIDTSDQST